MPTVNTLWEWLKDIWTIEMVRDGLRAFLILSAGFIVSRLVNRRLRSWGAQAHHRLMTRRVVTALILGLSLAWAMSELGLRLGVVLGAAGIFTVAIGFAAQTSVSNLISGLFLMAERPFQVGDIIEVDTITGEVLSVDMLSVKLCTFTNLLVRIPNETMLKANVTNLTHFPIRRFDLEVGVSYHADLDTVRKVLLEAADETPVALHNPAPSVLFLAFADSAMTLRLSSWAPRADYLTLRNTVPVYVKKALDRHGIEIPFPQRTLTLGATAEAYLQPVVGGPQPAPAAADERPEPDA